MLHRSEHQNRHNIKSQATSADVQDSEDTEWEEDFTTSGEEKTDSSDSDFLP